MSWLKLKTAVSKAVEAGNSSNITRNLKNYADTVVQHAGREELGKGSNPTSKNMSESKTSPSDSPSTDAEKKASKERVQKEELILVQREISALFLNLVSRFNAENETLQAELATIRSDNAKLKARLSLREQETDAASVSYAEIIHDAKKIVEMLTKHA
ncbi:hypothetical protein V6N13_103826 [Hibiscus sabdariffa]|uniref:Uncharacterized protein n=2 Tax=Hibiscus sabdariffa TaxID=183260 RepID=A0ABR2BSW1_9ROSI